MEWISATDFSSAVAQRERFLEEMIRREADEENRAAETLRLRQEAASILSSGALELIIATKMQQFSVSGCPSAAQSSGGRNGSNNRSGRRSCRSRDRHLSGISPIPNEVWSIIGNRESEVGRHLDRRPLTNRKKKRLAKQ